MIGMTIVANKKRSLTFMTWWQLYLVVFSLATIISLILTPVFEKIARFTNFLDRPDSLTHNRHEKPTPVLGGVAMFLSWIITIGVCMMAAFSLPDVDVDPGITATMQGVPLVANRLIYLCIGAFMATLLGFTDDYYRLGATKKFIGQLVIAIIAVWLGGVRITLFFNNEMVAMVVSVLWIVVIINAINFLDNMDGLAAGVSAIAMSLLTVVAIISGQHFIAAFGAAGAGCIVGFWFFNHSPASIFMGDSGSHFLGYSLAVLSASATYYIPNVSSTKLTFLIPLFILAIPLFDAITVVLIRLYHHKPIYVGDHNHISHRFVKMGMGKTRAVMMVHLLAFAVGIGVLPLMWGDIHTAVVVVAQAFAFMLIITILQLSVSEPQK